jgi:YegS/Rv2252/BmrU family lipid kinase
MKEKIVFLINPFSGTGDKDHIPELVKTHLDHSKYISEIILTEFAGHGAELANEKIKEGYDVIVAVGGDGTVNEIAGVVNESQACLGIIPGGSGNGFCTHLGISRNPIKAISSLNTGKKIMVDTCTMNDLFFLNVAGLGFDARVAYLTKTNKKRGFLQYFLTSMRESRHFKPQYLDISIDGQLVSGYFTAAVAANASMYGYNFTVAPGAALNDGLLDVMLIKKAPLYQYFLQAYRFLNKTLHKSNITETYQAKEIVMKSPIPIHCHVDGEGHDTSKEFKIRINPQSLQIIAPSQFQEIPLT